MKQKIQYFSHDVDMRNDMKIRALRKKYGCTGYAVWAFLLETLTDSEDFAIEMNDITLELLAMDYEVEPTELQDIIDFMLRINLLQKDEQGRIYSANHRDRLGGALDRFWSIRKARSEAGKASAEARRNNKIQQDANKVEQEGNKPEQMPTKESKGEESKGKEKENNNTISKTAPSFDLQKIVEIWNEFMTPKVAKLTDDRRDKVKSRLKDWNCKTQEEAEMQAHSLFKRMAGSDFLSGRNDNRWKATFDWIFANDKNYLKVLEGNYDNNRSCAAQPAAGEGSLGVGEFITEDGRRTYGTGKANIPMDAPARPSERYAWDASSRSWIIQ